MVQGIPAVQVETIFFTVVLPFYPTNSPTPKRQNELGVDR